MIKKLKFALVLIPFLLGFLIASAQTIPTLPTWFYSSLGNITTRNSTDKVQIPSLSGASCIGVSAIGTLISVSCGTGGGGAATTTINGFQSAFFTLQGTSGQINVSNSNGTSTWSFATTTISQWVNDVGYLSTTTGNWLGTWQSNNPSDFLSSSTLYQSPISAGSNIVLTGASIAVTSTPTFTTVNGITPSSWLTSAITTTTGNWLGTWQSKNPSDFLSSSTIYVATTTGSWLGTWQGNSPSYFQTNLNGLYVATTTGNWLGVWQNKNPSDFLSSSTTYLADNLGNWAGTWQGVSSSTFYLVSNPTGYVTSSIINGLQNTISFPLPFASSTGVQATLVSGTNIKTINSNSLLGSGDLVITGGTGISGSGTSTQIAYFDSSSSLTSDSGLIWNSHVLNILGSGHTFSITYQGFSTDFTGIPFFNANNYIMGLGFDDGGASLFLGNGIDSANVFGVYSGSGNNALLNTSLLSTEKTFTFPDKSGTFSLQGDNLSLFTNNSGFITSPVPYASTTGVQPVLVSGTNIKTINSNSLLGSGDLVITGGTGISGSGTSTQIAYFDSSSSLTSDVGFTFTSSSFALNLGAENNYGRILGIDAITNDADGGGLTFVSGAGLWTGSGGILTLTGGAGGETGNGGEFDIEGGKGGATSGNGGSISISAGSAQGGDSNGGNLILTPGCNYGVGTLGYIKFTNPNSSYSSIFDTSLLTNEQIFKFPNNTGIFLVANTDIDPTGLCFIASSTSPRGYDFASCGGGGGGGLTSTTPWTVGNLAQVSSDNVLTSIATSALGLQSTLTFPIPVASTSLTAGNMLVLTTNSLAVTTTPSFTTVNGVTPSTWLTSLAGAALTANNGSDFTSSTFRNNIWGTSVATNLNTLGGLATTTGNVIKANGTTWISAATSTLGLQTIISFPIGLASTTGIQGTLTFPIPVASTSLAVVTPLVLTTNSLSLPTSTASQSGFLASADFNTFNNKENQLWGLSGSNLFASSTSYLVGIGTTTPVSALAVVGSSTITSGGLTIGTTTQSAYIMNIVGNGTTTIEYGSATQGYCGKFHDLNTPANITYVYFTAGVQTTTTTVPAGCN